MGQKLKINFHTFILSQLVKNLPCIAGDPSSISRSGRSPREGNGSPLQCSGLENYMDSIVHGVAKSRT